MKLKLTADLDRDGEITFLGRQIRRTASGEDLTLGMSNEYYQEIFDGFGLPKNTQGTTVPPNLRDLYDKEDPKLETELSGNAAARFRSTLGRLSWLAMTRVDLVYYVSMLASGQASPKEKHERALRMVLRYLKGVCGYRQVIGVQDDLELRCYVDASWGSERSTDRKSISGGAVFFENVCLKAWARLQQAVALSSAEAELYGLVEGAKEAPALRRAVAHVFGWKTPPTPALFCDSEAALAISRADGLRKVRHVDLRVCFIHKLVPPQQFEISGPRARSTSAPAS